MKISDIFSRTLQQKLWKEAKVIQMLETLSLNGNEEEMTQVEGCSSKALLQKEAQCQNGCQTEWISGFIQSLQLPNSQDVVLLTIINSYRHLATAQDICRGAMLNFWE